MTSDHSGHRRVRLRSWPGDDPSQLAFSPPPVEARSLLPVNQSLAIVSLAVLALGLVLAFGATRGGSRELWADQAPPQRRESPVAARRTIMAFVKGVRYSAVAPSPRATDGCRLVYVAESGTATVAVIDARTHRVVRRIGVGRQPDHVATSGGSLLAGSAVDDSLALIEARSGRLQRRLPAVDPYNLYAAPDGKSVAVIARQRGELRLLHPRRLTLMGVVRLPGSGASHLAFTKDGRTLAVAAVASGDLIKVDVRRRLVEKVTHLGGTPVDVKLSRDGKSFLVANQGLGGVSIIDSGSFRARGFIRTGEGAHGLALGKNGRKLYVANRAAGSISVIDLPGRRLAATWDVGGSPDVLQLSTDGLELWASNRFHSSVSVIDARRGRVEHTIRVNEGPHGLAYFPSLPN